MPSVARPQTKAEATRIILERDPSIDAHELQKILASEFKMKMEYKMAYNYRRDALKKMGHPARPERNGSPDRMAATFRAAVETVPSSQLDELMRLGNEMGWDRVREVVEIAVRVK